MDAWQQIIQTALIGTDKQPMSTNDMDENLLPAIHAITSNTDIDKEEQFLQIATVVEQYTFCGTEPIVRTDSSLPICEAETQAYCSNNATNVLKEILYEASNSLLTMWLQLCASKQQIIVPVLLPDVLEKLVQEKHLRPYISCLGKRGAWLSQFNSAWQFATDTSVEELWQRGCANERKSVLQSLRTTNATQARAWLQETWPQENAASKLILLEAFATHLSESDVPWLESLINEKSSKVKAAVLKLLQQIPGSTIVQQYTRFLQQSLLLKKEKTMFGLSSKQVLEIAVPSEIALQMVELGLENLSHQKRFTDDEWMVFQLIEHIPPSELEQHLQLQPQNIIQLLQKEEVTKQFIAAVVTATVGFSSKAWAIALMQFSTVFYLDILPLIPLQQQEFYSKQFFKGHEQSIIQYAANSAVEWSPELTHLILQYTAANPYNYNKSFYNLHIHLIPTQAITILDSCTPTEGYASNYWRNIQPYIEKLLTLKQQTIQSFQ
ncbi:DUF5691 domain-containing protein [Parasediminibacterium paludis]|uniref:DUF5691 domain-containing protein n=1 Tax=Parasediminibacterium paludis TaxID=908966 RepID=A0ABV8Q1R7_9BACT